MTEYLPASFIFRLAPPDFDAEVKIIRKIQDNKNWDKPDFSSSYHRLQQFSLEDEWDSNPPYRHVAYNLLFKQVVISSESGLIRTQNGRLIADTFDHAQSTLDLFKYSDPHHIAIPKPQEKITGCWLSLLSPNQDNYYHCLVMNIGKLFQINAHEAKMIDGVLIPYHLTEAEYRAVEIALKLVFRDRTIKIKKVRWGQSLEVDQIFFPWNTVAVFFGYTHSGVISFFRQFPLVSKPLGIPLPTKFYIDRRAASNRILQNEDELIEILEQYGFAIIQLEFLTFDEQVHLFANADYIIGAHGAGLANMVFCKHGTKIVELMPHTLVRWCYRQIAMVANLPYQCIITQSHSESEGIPPAWASHHISIPDILDVLNHSL